nr:MAG TPA: putative transferase [Caudoviricetes sp.]
MDKVGIGFSEYQLLLRDRFLAQVDEDEKVLMIGCG